MANIQQVTPFFSIVDLDAMVAFFTDVLAFRLLVKYDDYAYVQREKAGFRLLQRKNEPYRMCAYLDVDDVDAFYAEVRPRCSDAVIANNPDGPRDQTYGQREFVLFAPEGNVLFVGQEIFKDTPHWVTTPES